MEIQETFRKIDNIARKEKVDLGEEYRRMQERYSNRLDELRSSTLKSSEFEKATLKATNDFIEGVRAMFESQGKGDEFDALIGFTSGKVAEIVKTSSDNFTK